MACMGTCGLFILSVSFAALFIGLYSLTHVPPAQTALTFDLRAVPTRTPKRILFPLPSIGFDITEVSVPWKILSDMGHQVRFATSDGRPSRGCDPVLLEGIWGGLVMKASDEVQQFYEEMKHNPAYLSPDAYSEVEAKHFDGIMFGGGHAPGMKEYLEHPEVFRLAREFWNQNKTVGAVCHGVLALARAVDPATGTSILYGRKTTAVPKYLESLGVFLTHFAGLRSQDYALSTTFPRYVEEEVRHVLRYNGNSDFIAGPVDLMAPLAPGTLTSHEHTFLVEDGHYLSARFWGDAYAFALRFARKLNEAEDGTLVKTWEELEEERRSYADSRERKHREAFRAKSEAAVKARDVADVRRVLDQQREAREAAQPQEAAAASETTEATAEDLRDVRDPYHQPAAHEHRLDLNDHHVEITHAKVGNVDVECGDGDICAASIAAPDTELYSDSNGFIRTRPRHFEGDSEPANAYVPDAFVGDEFDLQREVEVVIGLPEAGITMPGVPVFRLPAELDSGRAAQLYPEPQPDDDKSLSALHDPSSSTSQPICTRRRPFPLERTTEVSTL